MRFNLRQVQQTRRTRSILEPVIDQNRGTVQRDSINIQKNCGPDNVCIPDLRLSVNSNDSYILGSNQLLVFDVAVSNYGEDAFEAGFYMTIPPGLNFRKVEKLGSVHDTPITCTAPTPHNSLLKCDIGNPLSRNIHSKFQVILSPSARPKIASKYDFYFEANSTNPEIEGTEFDNKVRRSLSMTLETDLSVRGVAIDEEILYNVTDYKSIKNSTTEKDLGPHVVHMYEIRNGGPSGIDEVEIFFIWPHQTLSDEPLLYLLNQPETSRNVKCELSEFVNNLHIQRDSSLERTSYLSLRGAVERSSLHQPIAGQAYGEGVSLSAEEERKILQQEGEKSTGDASYDHIARANAQNAARTGGYGSYSASSQSSGPSVTYSASHNQSSFDSGASGGAAAAAGAGLYQQNTGAQQQGSSFRTSQQQGQNSGSVYSAGFGSGSSSSSSNAGRAGVRKLDDFPTEESVNQDISGLQSRTQAGGAGKRRMMSQQDGEAPRPDLISGVSVYDKVGAGNQGFQAGVVELDTLNRNNVDDEIRRHGSSGGVGRQQGGSSFYQSSGGSSGGQTGDSRQQFSSSSSYQGGGAGVGGQQAGSYGYQQQASYGAGAGGNYGGAHETETEEYYDDNDRQHQQPQAASSQQYQHYRGQGVSNPGTTVPVNQQFKYYSRFRRDAPDYSDLELQNKAKCNRTKCAVVRCTAGPLERGGEAWIAFRMRLIAETVTKVRFDLIRISISIFNVLFF